jgi:hypothetical protein
MILSIMTRLIYCCVLTRDIERMDKFYRTVLRLEPRGRAGYREFPTQPGIFSLWSVEKYEHPNSGPCRTAAAKRTQLDPSAKRVEPRARDALIGGHC